MLVLAALLTWAVPALLADRMPLRLYNRSATGAHGVVAAAKPEAAQVGIDILKQGGNAVDAAVAVGFALGVIEPNATGIGGGGFMILRQAGMRSAVVVDFREVAPAAARPDLFRLDAEGKVQDKAAEEGGLAIGVPGEVAGLLYALEHYGSGKLTRAQVLRPAITLARKGFTVTPVLNQLIRNHLETIQRFPACAGLFLKDGRPLDVGERLCNPDLAGILEQVAAKGRDAIYQGEMARRIAAEVQRQGGILTAGDLAGYQVQVRKPVVGGYRGYTILAAPPASTGTQLVELLNLLETFDLKATGWGTPETVHLWAEAMKLMFADRAKFMGDTAFVQVPVAGLTSKAYARELSTRIALDRSMADTAPGDPYRHESGSTTSFSVMDRKGNMVAVTKTISTFFGSGVVIPGAGFIMNDVMEDFVPWPGAVNSIEPGKRPLSNLSPALVLDPGGRPFMAIGSPGGSRVVPACAQVIVNVVDYGMPLQEAINAPRVFQMTSGDLEVEGRVSLNTFAQLAPLGHTLKVLGDWDLYFGGVQATLQDYPARTLVGAADPRRDGQAAGF